MTIKQLPTQATPNKDDIIPVSYNDADYGLKLGDLLMANETELTTNSNGNATTDLACADYVVLAVMRTDGVSICIPYASSTTWIIHLTSIGASPSAVTNTDVELLIFYAPRSAFSQYLT